MKNLMKFFKDEEGVTAIEYSLIAALIAIVIIAMVTLAGQRINNIFSKVANVLSL